MSDGTAGSRRGADARRVSRALPLGVLCRRRNPSRARTRKSRHTTDDARRTHATVGPQCTVRRRCLRWGYSRLPLSRRIVVRTYHRTCSHRVFGRTAVTVHRSGNNSGRSSSSRSSIGGGNTVLTATRVKGNIAGRPTRNGFAAPLVIESRLIISTLLDSDFLSPPAYSIPVCVVLPARPSLVRTCRPFRRTGRTQQTKCSRCCG